MRKLILDAGHGFNTKGKESTFNRLKSKVFYGKPVMKENNFNEAICNKLSVLYTPSVFITNEWQDIPLFERCKREHEEYTNDSLFVSIHADAFDKRKPEGMTVHYYGKEGRWIAYLLTDYFISIGHPIKVRTPVKSNFYVLRNTKSPAILIESGFMTNTHDLTYLMDEKFRNFYARDLNKFFKTLQWQS